MTRYVPTESRPRAGSRDIHNVTVGVAPGKTRSSQSSRGRSLTDVVRPVTILTASWCCSVGSTWALLLCEHDLPLRAAPNEWISSGVPILEPPPDSLAGELLAQHSYRLFYDPDHSQRARSVRRLGFVSRDAELISLAEMIRAQPLGQLEHPLALAIRWTVAGFSPSVARKWVKSGILSPPALHSSTLHRSTLHRST